MKITSAEFIKSAFQKRDWTSDGRPEIAFLGRSNVGKSSLINSLLLRKGLARTSNTPGRTQSINFFLINESFYFADLPGYGFARVSKAMRAEWGGMIIVIIGAQWGDEGKGKVVDLLADRFDIVSRYQGGHNAGHSVYVGDKAFVLRLLPSGIIHPDKTCVLGNGMVIDPKAFFEEVDQIQEKGIVVTAERLKVSSRAHLIMLGG